MSEQQSVTSAFNGLRAYGVSFHLIDLPDPSAEPILRRMTHTALRHFRADLKGRSSTLWYDEAGVDSFLIRSVSDDIVTGADIWNGWNNEGIIIHVDSSVTAENISKIMGVDYVISDRPNNAFYRNGAEIPKPSPSPPSPNPFAGYTNIYSKY